MKSLLRLIVATRNAHKTAEIRSMIGARFEVVDVMDFPECPEVEEIGDTFLENARLKAEEVSKVLGGWVLSDDSGLEVDALGGAPGVYSSSYGGDEGNHTLNNERLLREMEGKENRAARFRCVMVLAKDGLEKSSFEGTVEGEITEEHRGTMGFGYDPLFIPEGYEKTFAELGDEVKNTLSHRARALFKVVTYLEHRTDG